MESGEKSVPVKEGDKKSQKRHDRGNSGNDPEKAELLFPDPENGQGKKGEGAEEQENLNPVKDLFDFLEMDASLLGHGKRRKGKFSPVKKEIVTDQGVIFFQNFLLNTFIYSFFTAVSSCIYFAYLRTRATYIAYSLSIWHCSINSLL